MPTIYVAFRTSEVKPGTKRKDRPPPLMASGSQGTLKKRLAKHTNTTWTQGKYVFKANVPSICQAIENIQDMDAVEAVDWRVNDSGQVRKAKGEG